MSIPTNPLDIAAQTADKCAAVASRLANHGLQVQLRLNLLRAGATIVGVLAVAAEYLPKAQAMLGPTGMSAISLLAALTLIVGALSFMVLGENPPTRFADYARYIDQYSNRLREIAANDTLDQEIQKLRLVEIVHLAHSNLSDVKSQWPWALE